MEKKDTLIIVAVLVVVLVGILVFLNSNSTEEQQPEQSNQSQEQQSEVYQQPQMTEEELNNLEPVVRKSLEVRQTTEIINGQLHEVGDTYFVIERSVLEENQDISNAEAEPKYTQEYIKVNVTPATEIIDLSDVKYITVPPNITGVIDILNYLYDHLDNYFINVSIAAGTPVVNGEIETDYIEWTSWPKE
jgi:hypothetical protein